jgi:Rrf2 family protein
MRITQESDYALRILTALAEHKSVVDANSLSEETSVTLRFTLKILHKLSQAGFVKSYKGTAGGYALAIPADQISILSIVECIDGPIAINHCLEKDCPCTRMDMQKHNCYFHLLFREINDSISEKLGNITLADSLPQN